MLKNKAHKRPALKAKKPAQAMIKKTMHKPTSRTITTKSSSGTKLPITSAHAITTPLKLKNKLNTSPMSLQKRFGGGWGNSHYVPQEEVELRIMAILSELPHVNQEKLTPKAHLYKDLGLDSLNQVELIFMLEQEFEVQIDDDHAIRIETIPEAVHYFSHTPFAV